MNLILILTQENNKKRILSKLQEIGRKKSEFKRKTDIDNL